MSVIFSFPFCGISNFGGVKSITGTITVKSITHGITVTQEVNLNSMSWSNNKPSGKVELVIDDLYKNVPEEFEITVSVNDIFLFFQPQVITSNTLHYEIVPEDNHWINVPLKDLQSHRCRFTLVIVETANTVIPELAKNIEYKSQLTYVERLLVKFGIDHYLGKDTFKNLFFNKEIPNTWDIPTRVKNFTNTNTASKTVIQPDGIEYCYNNLGYRSNFDYTDDLKNKKVILCLGDSDLFGAGLEYKDTWATQLQDLLGNEYTVMNMGIQGASADAIARIGVCTMSALPNIVATLVQWPHTSLREFVSKTYKAGVHTHRNYDLPYADWWKHIDWQSNNYNYNKNKIFLENTAARYNMQYYDLYINRDDPKVPYDFVEFGIYSCIGPKTSRAVANYFYKKLDK
jgi:hypothetical protein